MKFLSSEKLSAHKYKTPEGYLVCTDAILARTGKQTYRKSEVFADTEDDGEIEIDRKAEEVFSPETLASFENKPITVEHPDENVGPDNYNTLSVGFVRDVRRGEADGQEVMLGTLVITDAQTIEEIENGEHVELSCGYDCDIADEEHPQQKNIRGNHVALCEQGRAGIARIVDSVKDDVEVDIEKLPQQLRNDMRNASNKKAALVGCLGQLQDLVDRAGDKKDIIKAKAEKILKDLKAEFNINENFIRLDSIKDSNTDEGKNILKSLVGKFTLQEMFSEINYGKDFEKYSNSEKEELRRYAKQISEGVKVFGYDSIEEEKFDINKRNKELKEDFEEFKEERMKDEMQRYEVILEGKNGYSDMSQFVFANSKEEAVRKADYDKSKYSIVNVRLNERYDDSKCKDTRYGIIPKYKYIRRDMKHYRIENDYDRANELKQELENNDGIPYVVFEIKDSVKDSYKSYKGYDIEYNFYGKNEYTVQYQGDDVWFKSEKEAKDFIDEITSKRDSIKDSDRNKIEQIIKSRQFELRKDGSKIQEYIFKGENPEDKKESFMEIARILPNDVAVGLDGNILTISYRDSIKDYSEKDFPKKIKRDGEIFYFKNLHWDFDWIAEYSNGHGRIAVSINEANKNKVNDSKCKDTHYIVACENGDYWFDENGKPNTFEKARKFISYEEADRWRRNKGQGSVQKIEDSIKDVEPKEGESKEDFISRFMSETKEEYPDEKQRLAVAYSYWNKKHTKDSKYTVRYTDNDVTYIHIVKAKSKLDAIKKIKK